MTDQQWQVAAFPSIGVFYAVAEGETKAKILKECEKNNYQVVNYNNNNKHNSVVYAKREVEANPKNKGRTFKIPFEVAATYAVMQNMVGGSEIGGLGIIEKDGDTVTLKKIYCCYDSRDSFGAHFSNPAELNRVMVKARMEGHPGDSIKAFWHSHPNFGPNPSCTDFEAIEKLLRENPKAEVYSIIFSHIRNISCRYDTKKDGTLECEALTVEVVYPDGKATICIDDVAELKAGTEPYVATKHGSNFQGTSHTSTHLYDNYDDIENWWDNEKKREDTKKPDTAKQPEQRRGTLKNVNLLLESYPGYYESNQAMILESYQQLLQHGVVATKAIDMLDEAVANNYMSGRLLDVVTDIDNTIFEDKPLSYDKAEEMLKKVKEIVVYANKLQYEYTDAECASIQVLDIYLQEISKIISLIVEPQMFD